MIFNIYLQHCIIVYSRIKQLTNPSNYNKHPQFTGKISTKLAKKNCQYLDVLKKGLFKNDANALWGDGVQDLVTTIYKLLHSNASKGGNCWPTLNRFNISQKKRLELDFLKIFRYVNVIDLDRLVKLEPLFVEEWFQISNISVEDFSHVIDLDQERPDLHLLPGDRLQDRQFGSLDVQAEEVDGRISHRLQNAKDIRKSLFLSSVVPNLNVLGEPPHLKRKPKEFGKHCPILCF